MTEKETHGGGKNDHKEKEYKFSVDGTTYTTEKKIISGAEIRTIAHIDPSYSLFLEVPGDEKDILIKESTSINLDEGEIKKFYTVPPATFGLPYEHI
jgi:hypothetical protein